MSRPKYAQKVDLNQNDIVKALRKIGCEVWFIGSPCDLLVGFRQHNLLIEIKQEGVKPRKDQKKQQDWMRDWPGQIRVCTNAEEAIRLVTRAYKS